MEDLVDVSMNTVTSSMAKNIRAMSNAKKGSEEYANAYKKLGVSVTKSNGELRDSEEVYWDVVGALGDMANETERDATAMTIFGKKAQDLNRMATPIGLIAGAIAAVIAYNIALKANASAESEEIKALNQTIDALEEKNSAIKETMSSIEEGRKSRFYDHCCTS